MRIKAITLENFKSIRERVRLELRPLTLLFGPNSAGKSTIVQALHYAREILERQNVDPGRTIRGGRVVDLGGFESLVHGHDLSRSIVLGFELDLTHVEWPARKEENWDEDAFIQPALFPVEHVEVYARCKSAILELTVRWDELAGSPFVASYAVGYHGQLLARIDARDRHHRGLGVINDDHPVLQVGDEEDGGVHSAIDLEEAFRPECFPPRGDPRHAEAEALGRVVDMPLLACFGALPKLDESLKLAAEVHRVSDAEVPLDEKLKQFFEAGRESQWKADVAWTISLLSDLLRAPGLVLREGLQSFQYIGPLRSVPPRHYVPPKTPNPSGWADGLAAWDVLATAEPALVEEVNTWLDHRLETGYRVVVRKYRELDAAHPLSQALISGTMLDEEDPASLLKVLPLRTKVTLEEATGELEVLPHDVGVGISQLLPVVVGVLSAGDGDLMAIEQPELHLHPALQVELGDLLLEKMQRPPPSPDIPDYGPRQLEITGIKRLDRQVDLFVHAREQQATEPSGPFFLIETHSEHVLLRVLRRIRQTSEGNGPIEVRPEDVAIYFVDKFEGACRVSELEVDERGESIGRWPAGFFEERDEELFS